MSVSFKSIITFLYYLFFDKLSQLVNYLDCLQYPYSTSDGTFVYTTYIYENKKYVYTVPIKPCGGTSPPKYYIVRAVGTPINITGDMKENTKENLEENKIELTETLKNDAGPYMTFHSIEKFAFNYGCTSIDIYIDESPIYDEDEEDNYKVFKLSQSYSTLDMINDLNK